MAQQEPITLGSCRGGGVLPMMAYAGRLRSERGIFFKLEVYERVGKSVICYCERAQKG